MLAAPVVQADHLGIVDQRLAGHRLRLLRQRVGVQLDGAELAAEQAIGHDKGADQNTSLEWKASPGSKPLTIAAWLAVGIPLAWGVWVTLQKTAVLFH